MAPEKRTGFAKTSKHRQRNTSRNVAPEKRNGSATRMQSFRLKLKDASEDVVPENKLGPPTKGIEIFVLDLRKTSKQAAPGIELGPPTKEISFRACPRNTSKDVAPEIELGLPTEGTSFRA